MSIPMQITVPLSGMLVIGVDSVSQDNMVRYGFTINQRRTDMATVFFLNRFNKEIGRRFILR
jgi:hypothetical protein